MGMGYPVVRGLSDYEEEMKTKCSNSVLEYRHHPKHYLKPVCSQSPLPSIPKATTDLSVFIILPSGHFI